MARFSLGPLWQSVTSRTAGRSSMNNSKSKVKINEIVDSLCVEYQLKRTDEGGRHVRDSSKWTFRVEELSTGKRATLELFRGPLKKMRTMLRHKWLRGEHLQAFVWHCTREPDFNCFLYKSLGNVRDIVQRRHLPRGFAREQIVVGFLEEILSALVDLNRKGLFHSNLRWDVLEVGDDDGRARLGCLEYVVDEKTARQFDYLTELRHTPPETLTSMIGIFGRRRQRDLNKIQTWILGSLLLDILLHKQISGPDFHVAKFSLTETSAALKNIEANVLNLNSILWSSDLSNRIRLLVFQMLTVDPDKRIGLTQALKHLKSNPAGHRSAEINQRKRLDDRKWPKWCCSCCSRHSRRSDNIHDSRMWVDADDVYRKENDCHIQGGQQPVVEEQENIQHNTAMVASRHGRACTIHWPKEQPSPARGRKVRITINVDP